MQVYLSDDLHNFKTRFIQLLCGYVQLEQRKLGKVILVNSKVQESIKLPGTPLYIPSPTSTEKSITEDEIEISKAISREISEEGFFFGVTKEEKEATEQFLQKIKSSNYDVKKLVPELNENLKYSTYLNDKTFLSISDLYCFALVVTEFNKEDDKEKLEYCNVSRWANYLQNLPGILGTCKKIGVWFTLPYKPFDLDIYSLNAPEQTKELSKKEEKKAKKEQAKEKKQNQNQAQQVHLMSKVDIRVGKIISIEENKEGDKLYNEIIDFGDGEIRKIASGLRGRVDIEVLRDSLVVCILNLEERPLKGWPSHGMILCVSDTEGRVEPLRPPEGSEMGDLVTIGYLPREPVPDKKNPWKKVCNFLKTNDDKEATYRDDKDTFVWHTDKGNIVAPTMANGTIS